MVGPLEVPVKLWVGWGGWGGWGGPYDFSVISSPVFELGVWTFDFGVGLDFDWTFA